MRHAVADSENCQPTLAMPLRRRILTKFAIAVAAAAGAILLGQASVPLVQAYWRARDYVAFAFEQQVRPYIAVADIFEDSNVALNRHSLQTWHWSPQSLLAAQAILDDRSRILRYTQWQAATSGG